MTGAAHPTPAEILERHFGEATGRTAAIDAHLAACDACRRVREDAAWVESLLASVEDTPPPDGLARALAAVAAEPPRAARPRPWIRSALPSAAAVAAGLAAIRFLPALVLGAGAGTGSAPGSVAILSGAGVAAALFLAAGSLVTLTVAPFLILEANASRGLRGASR